MACRKCQFTVRLLLLLTAIVAIVLGGIRWLWPEGKRFESLAAIEQHLTNEFFPWGDEVTWCITRRPKTPGRFARVSTVVDDWNQKLKCRVGTGSPRALTVDLPSVTDAFWRVVFLERDDGGYDYLVIQVRRKKTQGEDTAETPGEKAL